jgi:hypothetical protein
MTMQVAVVDISLSRMNIIINVSNFIVNDFVTLDWTLYKAYRYARWDFFLGSHICNIVLWKEVKRVMEPSFLGEENLKVLDFNRTNL